MARSGSIYRRTHAAMHRRPSLKQLHTAAKAAAKTPKVVKPKLTRQAIIANRKASMAKDKAAGTGIFSAAARSKRTIAMRVRIAQEKARHTGIFSASSIAKRRVQMRARMAHEKATHTGFYSADAKAKRRAAMKKRVASPAYRAKMSAIGKRNWARLSPEKKHKITMYLMHKAGVF